MHMYTQRWGIHRDGVYTEMGHTQRWGRYFKNVTVEWETLAVENFGESTNKAVGKKYFGKLTQFTKNWRIS